jgi:hypothetical protein
MALQVVSPSVSVFKVLGVKDGQEQTEEYVFQRGQILPDWVSSYQQFVLSQTGMCKQIGDFPDPALRAPVDMPAPVLMPEHDPRTVLGTEVTEPMAVTRRVTDPGAGAAGGAASAPGELPSESDTKPVWEDYAVDQLGMARGEAESMKKAELVKEVKTRARKQEREAAKDTSLPPTFAPQTATPQAAGASSRAGGDASQGENAAKGGPAEKPVKP